MTSYTRPMVNVDGLPRERLMTCLDEAASYPVMWVQAPAGFGKTSALKHWSASRRLNMAWVTLTPEIRHTETFLSVLLGALSGHVTSCDAMRAVEGVPEDPIINLLTECPLPLTLVLDGLENLHNTELLCVVESLIRHAGDGYSIILASRSHLDLPLNACRLEGRLGEVNREQLRLTPCEETELRALWGLNRLPPDWTALFNTLNGWIAGWVMLRLRLEKGGTLVQAHADLEGYLYETCLNTLPSDTLELLTTLSCCETLNDGLVVALGESPDAISRLNQAEARGAFIERSPDSPAQWVMEPFLKQVLISRLQLRGERAKCAVHARAADWFLSHGDIAQALRHGLKTGNTVWLSSVLRRYGQTLLDSGEITLVHAALIHLAQKGENEQPELKELSLQVSLSRQDINALPRQWIQPLGRAVQSGLHSTGGGPLYLYQAQAALMHEDDTAAESLLRTALSTVPSSLEQMQVHSVTIRGELAVCRGYYAEAREHFETAEGLARATHQHQKALWAMAQQAEIAFYRGQLELASRVIDRFHQYAQRNQLRPTPATEHMLRIKVCLNMEWLKLQAAMDAANQEFSIARDMGIADLPALARLAALALICDQKVDAENYLDEAFERLYAPNCHSDWVTFHDQAWLALHRLAGDQDAIERWLYRNPPLRQARNHFEYRHGLNRQMAFLAIGRPLQALEEGRQLATGRAETQLSYLRLHRLIQSSLSAWHVHQPEQALLLLHDALRLSERMMACTTWFFAGGRDPALTQMLDSLANSQTGMVHGALRVQELLRRARQRRGNPSNEIPEDAQRLALTRREWDVLKKMGEGLSNEQIAKALFVATSTVRSHLKSIYQKLGVHHREDARQYVNYLVRNQAASRNPSSP